jgi:putative ABC transport system substrate-binding protein
MFDMWRRDFIALLGGAAAWPLAARGQQGERMRRIGVLMDATTDDAESQARLAAFLQSLQALGWTDGRNVRIDIRWSAGHADDIRKYAMELVALAPDAILAGTGGTVPALQQATRTVPIVFAQTIDPVGGGFVKSLARPGGNTTGFTQFEYTLAGKWPELLKQVAPAVTRAAVLRSPTTAAGIGQWAVIQAAAASIGMELTPIAVRDPDEIEREIGAFAQGANGGLIQVVGAQANIHRQLVIAQAARHRLPAIYPYRFHVAAGGLNNAGLRATPNAFADTPLNWSRSRRMSCWPLALPAWRRCYTQPARCRSYSCLFPIPSVLASSTVWRGRAAMRPVCPV